jgi:hypothetical protein
MIFALKQHTWAGVMEFALKHIKAEGMEIRNVEITEKLLAEKVELAFIAKITGLSLAKIKEIQKSIKFRPREFLVIGLCFIVLF